MIVVVLTACPAGLRGDLTRWLLEISAGVFIGKVSARIREHLWERIMTTCSDGRALMVYTTNNEQGFDFKVHRHEWEPIDYDGVQLIRRVSTAQKFTPKRGWSNASKYRRARRRY